MRYDVHVAAGSLNLEASRFELERDEPLEEGDSFMQLDVGYKVQRVLPGHDEFDAIAEVEQVVGPGEGGPA